MFMSLFTNMLLCMSLTRLIVKSKFELKFGLFHKQTNITSFFSQTELKLFINNLVIYNPKFLIKQLGAKRGT